MNKTIFIIGGGGREHALAWKIAQSPSVEKIYIAPGNAGTAHETKCENVAIGARDVEAQLAWALQNKPDLTIVGSDDPLALGVVDMFTAHGLKIFGPTKAAAQLEWSKAFTKDFLVRHKIHTAHYKTFSNFDDASAYITKMGVPIVIKADGLALGKGVLVAETIADAHHFAEECLKGEKFGDSGRTVVIEEFLQGEEASCIALVDGETFIFFPTAQDHKRAYDGDRGPNTGGMGTYSPVSMVDDVILQKIKKDIIQPTISGMKNEGASFRGFLFAGLMIAPDGTPKVIEYNARLGDPETQSLMVRLEGDFLEYIDAALDGSLSEKEFKVSALTACTVILASGGYPNAYEKGKVITGISEAEALGNVKVFHAGTKVVDGTLVTDGGRVLNVTALGATLAEAQKRAYAAIALIHFEGMQYRKDIGWRALQRN